MDMVDTKILTEIIRISRLTILLTVSPTSVSSSKINDKLTVSEHISQQKNTITIFFSHEFDLVRNRVYVRSTIECRSWETWQLSILLFCLANNCAVHDTIPQRPQKLAYYIRRLPHLQRCSQYIEEGA